MLVSICPCTYICKGRGGVGGAVREGVGGAGVTETYRCVCLLCLRVIGSRLTKATLLPEMASFENTFSDSANICWENMSIP